MVKKRRSVRDGVQIPVRLSGSALQWTSVLAFFSVFCQTWFLAQVQFLPPHPFSSPPTFTLLSAHSSLSLPLLSLHLFLSPPQISCQHQRTPKGHRAALLHIYLSSSHSVYRPPPLSDLRPLVICATWPLPQGTSASFSTAVVPEWLISQRVK